MSDEATPKTEVEQPTLEQVLRGNRDAAQQAADALTQEIRNIEGEIGDLENVLKQKKDTRLLNIGAVQSMDAALSTVQGA